LHRAETTLSLSHENRRQANAQGSEAMALISTVPLELPVDGRQSEVALAIARGTARLLHAHGRCVVSELPLPSGRRADLVALDQGGEIWIVEIKSSIADFRADQKWQDYRFPPLTVPAISFRPIRA
jgi:RecB family endonuclease NucS